MPPAPTARPRRVALPGADRFRGRIIHSSEHDDGRDHSGTNAAVLGTASSGHDVALDLWEGGAEVTMLQRHPTTVVKSETLMELGFAIYSEAALERGITTEIADLLFASTPLRVAEEQQRKLWRTIRERDADYYDALTKAGFAIDFGDDETGLMMKAWRTGSGYYIDVGASQLIIDGEVEGQERRRDRNADRNRHSAFRRQHARGRPHRPVHRLPVDARDGGRDRLA